MKMPTFESTSEPIPVDELERYRDAEWALHDPGIQEAYEGQFVVAFNRQIIAHGTDAKAVVEQAQNLVNGQRHLAVFCAREDLDLWLND